MRSFMAIMMFCVRSSAPCLELFSAAPEGWPETKSRITTRQPARPRIRLRNGAWERSLSSGRGLRRLGYLLEKLITYGKLEFNAWPIEFKMQ